MSYDAIVIGGGVVGSSSAYQLQRSGLSVLLVDRADPGAATAAGAGIVQALVAAPHDDVWRTMAFAAAAFYWDLQDMLAGDGFPSFGFATPGALFLALDEEEDKRLDSFEEEAARQGWESRKGVGAIRRVSPDDVAALFPPLRRDVGAVHVAGMGRVDGRMLQAALQGAFAQRGGERRRANAWLRAHPGGRQHEVVIDGDVVTASHVVLATGSWPVLPGLEAVLPEPLDVRPQRGQIVHIDVPWARTDTWNIVNCFDANYFLSFPPHRVVFGATREEGVDHDWRQTVGGTAMLAGTALELAPGLRDATFVEVRVGFRPLTTDGRPLIGRLPGADGLYVATGFGAGLTQSPLAGSLITSLVLGKETAIDLEPYRPDRRRPQAGP